MLCNIFLLCFQRSSFTITNIYLIVPPIAIIDTIGCVWHGDIQMFSCTHILMRPRLWKTSLEHVNHCSRFWSHWKKYQNLGDGIPYIRTMIQVQSPPSIENYMRKRSCGTQVQGNLPIIIKPLLHPIWSKVSFSWSLNYVISK